MRSYILLLLLLIALTLIAVTLVYPIRDDFSPLNPYWNGLEKFFDEKNASCLNLAAADTMDPSKNVILIIGPSTSFTSRDIQSLRIFLLRGGRVVLADDFGTGNELLTGLKVPLNLTGYLLSDPLINIGSPYLPIAYWGKRRIALNYATTLNSSKFRVIAQSSFFSYLDINQNGKHDENEPTGPFPVAVLVPYGPGELLVISDSSILINSMESRESNRDFTDFLLSGKTPLVDCSHFNMSRISKARNSLQETLYFLQSPEVKYSTALTIPWIVALLLIRNLKKMRGHR
jgi:hypothetical protein